MTRHNLALSWRRSHIRDDGQPLTRADLAKATGYAVSTIADLEKGRSDSIVITEAMWLRYGLVCAAYDAKLTPLFKE